MKKSILTLLTMVAASMTGVSAQESAVSEPWPANWQGVMLQAFYPDSYTRLTWTDLVNQSDELSNYFKLVHVPNSAWAYDRMGAIPQYRFNQYSSFGEETALKSMINAFRTKGVGVIEETVLNHCRGGDSDGFSFPREMVGGREWQVIEDFICSDDDLLQAAGISATRQNKDTGLGYADACDLDHTNVDVQQLCKAYCSYLIDELGYDGLCYDFAKGYAGEYAKQYSESAKPKFSVGDYHDGSVDAVVNWIESTGKTSAAFDYPCKYQLNKAFATNDMTQLVWKLNGMTNQPAGLIHEPDRRQYAVTFVENDETDGSSNKFTGNIPAAYAFLMFSPGSPCVYYPHWKSYKSELGKLIGLRNAIGINNQSEVRVLKSTSDCYMAEITGTNGKAVVRIGSSADQPAGYTDEQLSASGTNYAVWTSSDSSETTDVVAFASAYKKGNFTAGGTQFVKLPVNVVINGETAAKEQVQAKATVCSSNTEVAEVKLGPTDMAHFMIKPKAKGEATITMTYGDVEFQFPVEVIEMPCYVYDKSTWEPVEERSTVNFKVGDTRKFFVTALINDLEKRQTCIVSSSNENILTVANNVDSEFILTGMAPGDAVCSINISIDYPLDSDTYNGMELNPQKEFNVKVEAPAEIALAVKLPGGTLHIPEPNGMALKLTPDEGYELHSLTLGGDDVTNDVSGSTYTVPELPEATVLTAVFNQSTGIDGVKAAPAVRVAVYGNRVEISGSDAEAAFYDVAGRLICRTAERSVVLPATGGVVIMTLGGETFKFAL